MPPLSKQDRDNILRKARGKRPQNVRESDWRTDMGRMVEIDEAEAGLTDMEVWDLARLVVNVPGSLARNLGLMGDAAINVFNPDMQENTVAQVGNLALSGLHAGARFVLGDNAGSEEEADTFYQFAKEIKRRYGTQLRKTIVEDPVGIFLDFQPATAAAGKLGGLSRVSSAAKNMLPTSIAGNVMRGGAKGVEGIVRGVVPEAAGLTTGMPGVTIREGYKQAARGGESAKGFTGALREQVPLTSMQQHFSEAFDVLYKKREKKYTTAVDKTADVTFNRRKVVQPVLDYLESEWGIRPLKTSDNKYSRAVRTNKKTGEALQTDLSPDFPKGVIQFEYVDKNNRIMDNANRSIVAKNFTYMIDTFEGVPSGLPATIPDLQNVRAWMRDHKGASTDKYRRGNAAIEDMLKKTGKAIEDASPETWKAISEYAKDSQFMDDLKMVFSEGGQKEARITVGKVLQAFRENPSADITRAFLTELEEKSGRYFSGTAAGAMMSQWAPAGIHARNIMIGALGGAAFVSPYAILAIPMVMPRMVGELMNVLGAGTRAGKAAFRWVDKIQDLRRKHLVGRALPEGVAIGAIVQRLLEQGVDVPPIPEEIKPFKMPAPPQGSRKSPSQMLGGGFAG